jgi:hypothetical protein
MIISVQDFVGKYELHKGMFVQSKLQNYIDIYVPRYLKQLLGVDFYNQFVSDLLNDVPQSPNFLDIFNPISEDLGYSFYTEYGMQVSNSMILSDGMIEMLKGFIYFEYAKDLYNQMTPYGNVKPVSENSEIVSTGFSLMYTRYNEAINSYRAIQRYIRYTNNVVLGQIVNLSIINGGAGYLTTNGLQIINGSGVGATCNIVASNIGGIYLFTVTANGSGYTDGSYTITTGSGYNAEVTITTNLGSVVSVDIDFAGFDYLYGDVITIPGGNDDAFFVVDNVTNGGVTSIVIVDAGKNFIVNDFINVKDGVNLTCQCEITYVGIGDYKLFRGIAKSTAYWL